MGHSYYSYTKEELVGNGPKLPVIVMEDNAEVFHSMAVEMVDEIRKHNENGEKTVFICPVGPVGPVSYTHLDVYKRQLDLLMLDISDREPTNFASTVKLIFLHLHMYLMVML